MIMNVSSEDQITLNGSLVNPFENPPLDCPEYGEYGDRLHDQFVFWLEGVVQDVIAIGGLIGNLISAIILCR